MVEMRDWRGNRSDPDEESPCEHETDLNTRKQHVQGELVVAKKKLIR